MLNDLIRTERLVIILVTHFMTLSKSATVQQLLASVRFQCEKNIKIYQKILAAQ